MESDTLIDEMWCIDEERRWRRDNDDQIEQAHGTWKVPIRFEAAGSLNHNSRPITLSIASPLRNVNQLNLAKSPRLMKSFAKLIVPSCYLDSSLVCGLWPWTMPFICIIVESDELMLHLGLHLLMTIYSGNTLISARQGKAGHWEVIGSIDDIYREMMIRYQ